MNQRTVPSLLFILSLLVCTGFFPGYQPKLLTPALEKPPNIIFILADDMGWGDVGCYGNKSIKTPNLDKLAREGTLFTHFYVNGSVCSPSRSAFLTGQYPARNGMHEHLTPVHQENAVRNMPDFLKQKGNTANGLVELIDIYPSLCQLAGLPVPGTLQGMSFVPLLENPGKAGKSAAFSQHTRESYKRDIYPDRDVMGYSVRTPQYRFTRWQTGTVENPRDVIAIELYDHQKDPDENVNLAGNPAYAAIVKQMTLVLNQGGKEAMVKKT